MAFVTVARLQREEEAAYAISHGAQSQSHTTASHSLPGHSSLGAFSKFEEKKTNEKTRKVTTVKKFFSTSSSRSLKKGVKLSHLVSGSVGQKNVISDMHGLFLCSYREQQYLYIN